MNIAATLLGEDIRAMQRARVAHSLREHRMAWLASHGDTSSDIVCAIKKHGPMSKNLLHVAIPDKLPGTVNRMVARMLRKGVLTVQVRGEIEVFCCAAGTQ